MKNKPIFSVITLCYNTGAYVIKTLECIKNQTIGIENIQHIIIDDCSKDESVELIKQWLYKNSYNAEFICNNENIGIQNSLNKGIKLALGKYLFLISDDLIVSSGLQTIFNIFNSNVHESAIIFTPVNILEEDKNKFSKPSNEYIEKSIHLYIKPYTEVITNKISISAPGVFYNTDVLKKLNGFDGKYFIEDFPMWVKLAKSYNFLFYNEAIVTYRVYCRSLSQSKKIEVDESYIKVLVDEVKSNLKEKSLLKDINYCLRYRVYMFSKLDKIKALVLLWNSSILKFYVPNLLLGVCIIFNINYLKIIKHND